MPAIYVAVRAFSYQRGSLDIILTLYIYRILQGGTSRRSKYYIHKGHRLSLVVYNNQNSVASCCCLSFRHLILLNYLYAEFTQMCSDVLNLHYFNFVKCV